MCKFSDCGKSLWAFAPLKIFINDISVSEKVISKKDKSVLAAKMNEWLFLKIKIKICMKIFKEDKFYFIVGAKKNNMIKENRKLLKLIENF